MLRVMTVCVGLIAMLCQANSGFCQDGPELPTEIVVTLDVRNLKGVRLKVGDSDDKPTVIIKEEDLVLTGRAFVGQSSVDTTFGPIAIKDHKPKTPKDGEKTESVYDIVLRVQPGSRVMRIQAKLPTRQLVDLNRLSAITQTVVVSMPEETESATPPKVCRPVTKCARLSHHKGGFGRLFRH